MLAARFAVSENTPSPRLSRIAKGPLRAFLNKYLTGEQIDAIKRRFACRMPGGNLALIAYLYGSDKWGYHNYIQCYQRHFSPLRGSKVNLLEIGVGGYDRVDYGGHSLRMWKKYFPRGRIYGIDICDKTGIEEPRIKTFQGSQDDPEFLHRVVAEIGRLDIVIDDGSHQNSHVISSFKTLFPLLDIGGLYVIEDLQTSYDSDFGGNSENLNDPGTSMFMLRGLVDGLNYQEYLKEGQQPSYFDKHIIGLHFYHNMVFIQKGVNDELSLQ
jgi:cephalosporin hydroxylase